MSRTFTTLASALGAAAVTAAVALAQQPRLTNGRVTTQPAPTLQQAFRAAVNTHADIGWIGYGVPVVDGERIDVLLQFGQHVRQRLSRLGGTRPAAACAAWNHRPTAR